MVPPKKPAIEAKKANKYCGSTNRNACSGGLPGYDERKIVFRESMQTPTEAEKTQAS